MIKSPIFRSLLLPLLILLPILGSGYILTFDMIWGPHLVTVSSDKYTYPLHVLIDGLSAIIPGWVVQKFILIVLVSGAALGVFYLLKTIRPHTPEWIYYATATLYVFNPFFYTRFIAGQWLVLAGMALLPWVVRQLYLFFTDPTWKSALIVTGLMCFVSFTSIHTIGIAVVCAAAIGSVYGRSHWKRLIPWVGGIIVLWLAVNAFWLVPVLTHQSEIGKDIVGFSRSEMTAFATHGTIAGSPALSALFLTGFWGDQYNRYIVPSDQPLWWVGAALFMTLVLIGITHVITRRDTFGFLFVTLGGIALILGVGIAWSGTAPITQVLLTVVPFYNGYREPHKWIMLLALCYMYFVCIGFARLDRFFRSRRLPHAPYITASLALVAPLLFAPALPLAAAGQLHASSYPTGWQQAKTYLASHASSSDSVLVVPWHMYLPISFAGRVVGNPAGYYFDQKMITGDNFEMAGVPPQDQTPVTKAISETVLPDTPARDNIAPKLRALGIQYVMLLKEDDWRNYDWLGAQPALRQVIANDTIIMYAVEEQS